MPIDVGSASGSIRLDVKPVGEAVNKVNRLLDGLATGSSKSFATAGDAADKSFKKVRDGAGQTEKALGGIEKKLSKALGPAALLGFGASFAAVAGIVVKSSLQMNATLETTELQFETLMGSADKAQEHVAGLFKFAEKTPFETGPIIQASLKLQTFGGAALNTMGNIELLGDAAAATNAPIDELGFWVGRLYANLEAGQPFGEAAMRLQELAVMTPQARAGMEALQKSGASAAEVFAYFQKDLEKFGGAMDKQAGTFSGMTSTIKDQIQILLADAMKPFFETSKDGMAELIELLNDPDIVGGIKAMGESLGEVAGVLADLTGDFIQFLSVTGKAAENKRIMDELGMSWAEQGQLSGRIAKELGLGVFAPGSKEDLALQIAINEALKEQYGATLAIIDAQEQRAAAHREQQSALEEYGATQAEILDNDLAGWADVVEAVQGTGQAAARSNRPLTMWGVVMRTVSDNAKLLPDRLNKNAQAMAGLQQRAEYLAGALQRAADAQTAFNDAIVAVEGDYTNKLPGEDKPLVTPERTVSVTTGGLSPEQQALLGTYREEVKKLEEDLFELTNGIGTFGMEQEKVNERVVEAQGEIAHYRALMGPLEGVTGQVSTAHQGLSVNVGAAHRAIYEQLLALPGAAEAAILFAGATGIMSDKQMEAALAAAAVQIKIEELAGKIAAGMPIEKALADLDSFISKIENGVDPATVTLAETVPARIVDMKDRMSEDAGLAGESVPTAIATGINTTLIDAETAATDAATAVIDAVATTFGVESPSTVFAAIGGELMAGLDAGMTDETGQATGAAERVGRAVVRAFDDAIDRMPSVGKAIIDGVVRGVEANRGSLIEKMKEIARAAYIAAMAEINAKSPSRLFMLMGDAIIDGIVAGIDRSEETLYEKLHGVAETMHGIATGVFGLQSDALEVDIDAADSALSSALTNMRWSYLFNPEQLETLLNAPVAELGYLLRQFKMDPNFQTDAAQAALENAIQLADERNALEQEYIRQQEELKALEEARQKLDFLGYQMDLLRLIAENDLDTSILDGLELGLDANMTDIIAAMTAAVGQLITATEEELDIASPSGVFQEIGGNIMRGLALGIADHKSLDTVLRERLLDAQQLGLSLSPQQSVYIFGGFNATIGGGGPRDALRDLYYQSLYG